MNDRSSDHEQPKRQRITGALHAEKWPRWPWMLGHPLRIEVEQAVARDVPASEYDDLVAGVERFMRLEGRTVEIPGAYLWKCGGLLGGTRVAFIPWSGGMGVRVIGRYWDRLLLMLLAAAAIGWMPGLVVVAGFELGPSPGAVAIVAGYVLTYVAACVLWHARGREQERGLIELVERLVVHLVAHSPEPGIMAASERAAGAPSSRLPVGRPALDGSGALAVTRSRVPSAREGTSEPR